MGKMKIVYLSTYPPFEDGISTFVHDLVEAQRTTFEEQTKIEVAAIDITGIAKKDYPEEVKWVIPIQDKEAYIKAADEINADPEVAWINVQHEYGIYGGDWGAHLTAFLRRAKKPIAITMHTVLPRPKKHVRELTQKLLDRANMVVVLTLQSKFTLQKLYQVPENKIKLIQHGIHPVVWVSPAEAKKKARLSKRLVLRTFGFLSRGKGIEYVIRALPKVAKKYPQVVYYVMGETHPLIKRTEGEKYRDSLIALVAKHNLEKNVRFVNKYLSVDELLEALKATDIYISTSLNADQAVSGTFSYALGSGRAVVSTKFSQALEFIDEAVGVLVDIKKPTAYAKAIISLLDDDYRRERMHRRAYERTRNMLWTRVAVAYQQIYWGGNGNKWWEVPEISLKHLYRMTSRRGMWQFARKAVPNKKYGYTLDDNARAAIFCVRAMPKLKEPRLATLLPRYIRLMEKCQQENGMFLNYVSANGTIEQRQNKAENLNDANGRAMWALGEIMGSKAPRDTRKRAKAMWDKRMALGWDEEFLRTRAYLIKGLAAKGGEKEEIAKQADVLMKHYQENADGPWKWLESSLAYANGILPEALWLAYEATGEKRYAEAAQESLEFLCEESFKGEVFSPVGNKGWHVKGEMRADFDQQPEEALAIIEALIHAFRNTNDKTYRELAARAFWWWRGDNLLGQRIVDTKSGGSRDGLNAHGANPNQGAESTLAYLLSALVMEEI